MNLLVLLLFFGARRAECTQRARCARRAAGYRVREEGHGEMGLPPFFLHLKVRSPSSENLEIRRILTLLPDAASNCNRWVRVVLVLASPS